MLDKALQSRPVLTSIDLRQRTSRSDQYDHLQATANRATATQAAATMADHLRIPQLFDVSARWIAITGGGQFEVVPKFSSPGG